MKSENQAAEVRLEQSQKFPTREFMRLSDIDRQGLQDLQGMFGLWKEADHCDKDIVANDAAPLRASA